MGLFGSQKLFHRFRDTWAHSVLPRTCFNSGTTPWKCIFSTSKDTREEGQSPSSEIMTSLIKLCRICASNRVRALSIGLTQIDFSKDRAWTLSKCVQGKERDELSDPSGPHRNCTWICCFWTPVGSVDKFSWNKTHWGLQHQRQLY